MKSYLRIHPHNPQLRLIKQAADIIRKGGVVIYPTDTTYAIGCGLGHKQALDRICQIRRFADKHNFTILCRDLSELATYATVSNAQFRILKAHTPGAYTFILNGTSEVPKLMMHPKRKTIGLRVPDNEILQVLLAELNEPIITSTLQMPDDEYPLADPEDIKSLLAKQIDCFIDSGFCGLDETSIINLQEDVAVVVREGLGDVSEFA